jgi:predicted nucleic acid-binding protein
MNRKIFVDTDVVIDLLTKREPFYQSAARVFSLAADKKIDLYISPVLISNLFYILRKILGREEAINTIRKLRILVGIVNIDEEIVDLVLSSKFKDIEDGFQYYGALQGKIGILLTRNTKDFIGKEMSIMNCDEFIEYFKTEKKGK